MPEDLKARPEDSYLKSVWNGQTQPVRKPSCGDRGPAQCHPGKDQPARIADRRRGGAGEGLYRPDHLGSGGSREHQAAGRAGLIARPRILQLERTAFGLEGQIADAKANIAKARQAIAEQQQQIAQLDNDRMADVTKDLRDTQAKMLEVIPKAMNAKAVLGRMEIRSPYTGRVVALTRVLGRRRHSARRENISTSCRIRIR